jgi:hypothetical protein
MLISVEKCRDAQINPPVYETFSDRRGKEVCSLPRGAADEYFQVAARLGPVESPFLANALRLGTGTTANISIMPRKTQQRSH